MRGTFLTLLAAAAIIGCDSSKTGSGPVVAAPTQPGAQAQAGAQTQAGAPAAGGIHGQVLERIDASTYSYLRLKTAQGEVWTAVPEAKVEKGTEVTVVNPMLMSNFESKTLNRTFAEIYFGTLATAGEAAPAAPPAPPANPHAQMGASAAPVAVGKVEKAPGSDARTIAEVWAQKGALKEKTVTIRGQVVRYNPGVMGRNWMHLQDGSGDPAAGTHDITVTSQDPVAKGEVVTVRGTVRLDKDFGSGYAYAVIVEEAKVVKK